jgi:hypothetical protein
MSFEKITVDLVESLFSLHTEGFTHNKIALHTIFFDQKINSWVLMDFSQVIHEREMEVEEDKEEELLNYFKKDVVSLGRVLLQCR